VIRQHALRDRLALIVIADPSAGGGRPLLDVVRAALRAGAPSVQLRAKALGGRDLSDLARLIVAEARSTGALCFVNDRLDVALVAEAHGAHLGDDDVPLAAARRFVPPEFLLGRSVDDAEEASAAVRDGADYLGLGPVFGTTSKGGLGPAIGVAGVRAVTSNLDVPVVGIGGIDVERAADVIGAGAAGVAVIGAVMGADNPGAATAELLRRVRSAAARVDNGA
jgi:thiamine-phosphate pyrophosphorylase